MRENVKGGQVSSVTVRKPLYLLVYVKINHIINDFKVRHSFKYVFFNSFVGMVSTGKLVYIVVFLAVCHVATSRRIIVDQDELPMERDSISGKKSNVSTKLHCSVFLIYYICCGSNFQSCLISIFLCLRFITII